MSLSLNRRDREDRRAKSILCALCVLCGCLSSSCGYALAGRGSFLPDYIRTIGIPTFLNRTTVFNLETMLTRRCAPSSSAEESIRRCPRHGRRCAADRRGGERRDRAVELQHAQLATRYSITMRPASS